MIRVDDGNNTRLDDLLRFVTVDIPEVPYEVGIDMVRTAYVEFARKTGLLGAVLRLHMQRGLTRYEMEVPAGYDVFAVRTEARNHRWCTPSPHTWCTYQGTRYRMDGNTAIEFVDAPSRDGDWFQLPVQVIPNECAQDIPRGISGPYGRGIAMGAVADMLEIPNRAWSNPNLAQLKRRQFHQTCAQGRALDITNHGAQPPTFPVIRFL